MSKKETHGEMMERLHLKILGIKADKSYAPFELENRIDQLLAREELLKTKNELIKEWEQSHKENSRTILSQRKDLDFLCNVVSAGHGFEIKVIDKVSNEQY